MNIIKIESNNQVNGPGLRCVVWTAGCIHHCLNCHNPETWDPMVGHKFNDEDLQAIENQLQNDEISGVTLSGGDPLHPNNREEIAELCHFLKNKYPNKNIWCYTGYLYEEVKDLPVFNFIDFLVDGRFIQALYDKDLLWCGSSNQRIIDIKQTKETGKIALYRRKY